MATDPSKLKHVNLELKEIINNSWDGIGIIDKETNFIYINDAFLPMFGYKKDELLHTNLISLLHLEYKEDFLKLLEENSQNSYQTDISVVCKRKDLKPIYLKITVSLMLNRKYFVINAKDITKEISDDEILDNYVLAVHIDKDGSIVDISKAFIHLSEFSKDEIIGKNFKHLVFKSEHHTIDNMINTIRKDEEWQGKVKNIKKDESFFWVNIKAKPQFNKYGDITGAILLMFDITNELDLNKQIEQKDKILVDQSKLAIMNDTIKILSHEWRQPLNLISINAQKLELDFNEDEIKDQSAIRTLQDIKKQAEKLSKTIEDFRVFTDSKKSKFDIKASQIITHAISIFKINFKEDFIKIGYETLNDVNFQTYTNELTNVLVNILINAKEAILKNSITNGEIFIKEYVKNDKIYFEIKDNAHGIDETVIDKIFEPYYSTKDSQQGVGLGLYTCKIFIVMHLGGEISVKNTDDGALFTVTLPLN